MPPSPFDRFQLAPCFDLDAAELQRRYVAQAARCHPDRFTDPLDQADAADQSARLNDAYRQLSDPVRRAEALLAVLGGPGPEQDKSLPPDLLAEMMDIREQVEEAQAARDRQAMANWRHWADQQRQEHLRSIAGVFGQIAGDAADRPALLRQVRLQLNSLRYIDRMIEQLD